MERLTKGDGNCAWAYKDGVLLEPCELAYAEDRTHIIGELMRRLASYEDTGLGPEDMATIKLFAASADSEKSKRLLELSEADAAGLLVVWPCKIGTTLFRVWAGEIRRYHVVSINAQNHIGLRFLVECMPFMRFYWDDEIGKSVFLTPEEAEKALEVQYGKM